MGPVRPRDIREIVSKKSSTSAPGPDGMLYGFIKKLPSTHHILATLFSKLLVSGDPPEDWSNSNVSLIYKSGEMDNPANFRMISLTSCVGKLFHQIVANRIEIFVLTNDLIDSETQKAFLKGINGCIEHTTIMRELIADARSSKRTIHVTFFDLADAFGSVEHNLIDYTLRRNGIPTPVCDYVQNLYSRLQGSVKTKDWTSEPFNFKRGVFQGDPLSPIIFLMVFNPIIQHLKLKEDHGYSLNGTKFITLPFADDFCLITSDKRRHQKLMNEVLDITQSMNLQLKPVKCKTISIRSGVPCELEFNLGSDALKTVKEAPEKFLGCQITFHGKTRDTFDLVSNKLSQQIQNIQDSAIRNEYKLRIYVEYSIPSLRYLMTVHELTDSQLELLDHLHTNTIKGFLGLSSHGPTPAIIHSPNGLAIPRFSDVYVESHTLAFARCMMKADERVLHALRSKYDRESQWKRKMVKHGVVQWRKNFETAQEVSNPSKWEKVKKNIKELLSSQRSIFWQNYIQPLIVQGNLLKLIESESSDLTWRSIIYNLPRGVLSFAVRSAIDFLPTFNNLKTWGKRTNTACKLCSNKETLQHILNMCHTALNQGRFTWRHNSVLSMFLSRLQDVIQNSIQGIEIFADISGWTVGGGTIPPNILTTSQRPDLVLINAAQKRILLMELTVPFEMNINDAHSRKMDRYGSLVADLQTAGYKPELICVEIGSRGLITKDNKSRIKSIFKFTGHRAPKHLFKDLCKCALLCSYALWNCRHEAQWTDCPYIKI